MTNYGNPSRSEFMKGIERMAQDLRNWVEAPHILIGKAALVLLEHNEPVTFEAIRDCVTALPDEKDADMIRRTLELLDQSAPVS